ncbi:MAG: SMP-30/gluconolactonase/LRE family protein [bacterium]
MPLSRSLLLLGLLVFPVRDLSAQKPTGISEVDSAAVARLAWRRGQIGLRTRDVATANRELAHAAAAWPTQPAYLWGSATAAALSDDRRTVVRVLTAYADMGLGNDLESDSIVGSYLSQPSFTQIATRLQRNRMPVVRSRLVATLADSTIWPEGMDLDGRTQMLYVTSVRHRTIVAATDGALPHDLWPREMPGMGAMLAVRVDTARNVLWATTSGIPQMLGYTAADSSIAALLEIGLSDGKIQRRWNLPVVQGGHVLGDVAVGPLGDVYFSDSNEPFLYRLRPNADTLERITSPLFRSLQGVAPAPDGRIVYVADYSHGITRVDMQTGRVTRVADAPHSTSLGCDGIVFDRNGIIAIQNGVSPARVIRFALDSSGTRFTRAEVLDQNSLLADEPTIGTIVGNDFVYVANSQWEKFRDDGTVKPGVRLTPPLLLAVPLPK